MALPTASDNVFPKIIESMNTSDPAAPSDSSWKVYAKANGIYARSSNTIIGPFGSGGSLTDHTHAATGSGANGGGATLAPTSLTLPGGGLITVGTSFPGSPTDNDLCYRTDTECGLYRYESTGTKWLCSVTHLLSWTSRTGFGSGGISATTTIANATTLGSVGDMWIEDARLMADVLTTSSGTQYWDVTFDKLTAANAATTLATLSTISNTADTWVEEKTNVDAIVDGATYKAFRVLATKVSTPGNLVAAIDVSWRHVFDV